MTNSNPQRPSAGAIAAIPTLPEPSEREQADIVQARKKLEQRPSPTRAMIQPSANGQPCIGASHSDELGWLDCLTDLFGSSSPEFALEQFQSLMRLTNADQSADDRESAVNSMLAIVSGVQPQSEMEGVLAVQLAAAHQLAMNLLTRVGRAEHIPLLDSNGNMAVKLLRASREHAEALAKLRRGGSQTVRVEHVHVHSGAQAIVGNVTHPGGRGDRTKTRDQPHAPGVENADTRFLTTEPVTPLRSQDPQREAVPVACSEGTDEVPDARRRKG
jgi:hypothetical protein